MSAIFIIIIITGAQNNLNRFLARQDYPAATRYYLNQIARNPGNPTPIKDLARVYDHWRRFDSSLYWWQRALKFSPLDDSAIIGRWQALYQLNKSDSTKFDSVRQQIAAEARPYLYDTTYRSLFLACKGLLLSDTIMATKAIFVLTALYPDSPLGYELIGTMFYDSLYPVWNNDTLKVLILSRFLARFPESEWRPTFYLYLLSSLFGLKDTVGLLSTVRAMINDDTLDPFRYRYAATFLNRMKIQPETAEVYARRAILLEPKAQKPKNKPIEQWQLEYPPLSGLARTAIAEALMLQNRHLEALPCLQEAINQFRWDPDNEATPAPFYTLMGEVYEHLGRRDSAIQMFVRALVCGDSRNQWTPRADSGLRSLGIPAEEHINLARKILNYRGPLFTDITDSVELSGLTATRVAWGDYNNDGFEDLLLNGERLFRNDSGRHFTEVTLSVGLGNARGRGGVWADFNNDYWLDIYVSGSDTIDRIYKNHFGQFTDVTDSVGYPSDPCPTEGVAWADYDNDGWVDIYCANYEDWETRTYYPDRLYKNEQGQFKDVTTSAGIIPPYGENLAGRGVNWGDFDNDGYQDCYVSNYRLTQNLLWHNNHDGRFTNLAPALGVAGNEVSGWFGHTIGSVWGDYDNDGDLDLFCANLAHPRYIEFSNRSFLYENRGFRANPRFIDRRAELGIRYEETHSDPAWGDVDNDGDLDLYITSVYEGRRSFLYLNQLIPSDRWITDLPQWQFAEATYLSGTRVFNGWGCAFADFDNDGDLDLVVGSGSGLKLLRNDTRNNNHWLKVKIVGTKSNAAGIGARIVVRQGKRQWLREVEGGKGTTSQNSLVQHFGLGQSAQPVTVEVKFGTKPPVILKNIFPDRLLTVTEP